MARKHQMRWRLLSSLGSLGRNNQSAENRDIRALSADMQSAPRNQWTRCKHVLGILGREKPEYSLKHERQKLDISIRKYLFLFLRPYMLNPAMRL